MFIHEIIFTKNFVKLISRKKSLTYLFQFRLSSNDCGRKLVVLAIVNISKYWTPSIKIWADSKKALAQISTTRVQIFWFGWQLPSNIDMWIHEVSHLHVSMPLKIKNKNYDIDFFLFVRLI